MKASGKRLIVSGLLIAGIGLLITLATYSSASEEGGGQYFIFWGPVAYGLYRAFRGLLLVTSAPGRPVGIKNPLAPTHPTPQGVEEVIPVQPVEQVTPVEEVIPAVEYQPRPTVASAVVPSETTTDPPPPPSDPLPQNGLSFSSTLATPTAPPERDVPQHGGDPPQLRRCPHCAEEIQPAATTCRFCGRSTKPPTNRLALWSLIVNLLGVPIGSIAALILGYRALRQIREQEGRQGGKGLAIAGIVWGWGALAVAALLLLILASIAGTKVSLDEVKQEAANVAFAERAFAETHGRFSNDLAELGFVPRQGVEVHVVTTPHQYKFCVDVVSSDYAARTWDSQFRDGGETINVWSGRCQEPVRPGASPIPPSWLDTSPADPATPTPSPATPTISPTAPSPSHFRGWLFVASPSAVRVHGHGPNACGRANYNERERSWVTGELLIFSKTKLGSPVIGSVHTSSKAQLVYMSVKGKGLTCGWLAEFDIGLPIDTSFYLTDEARGLVWGPVRDQKMTFVLS